MKREQKDPDGILKATLILQEPSGRAAIDARCPVIYPEILTF